jgi:hypothetical protein
MRNSRNARSKTTPAGSVLPLSPAEFEQYVAALVQSLSFAKTGTVYTNKHYQGVRQPGSYEIDVALEIQLAPPIHFTLIVECKNWQRPVDRPIVQKLTQTRDATGADKAAIASPIGFTKEAVVVARTLGVALWVITIDEWLVYYSNGVTCFSFDLLQQDELRNWTTNPAQVILNDVDGYQLLSFPEAAKLPEHLKWVRFIGRRPCSKMLMFWQPTAMVPFPLFHTINRT